MANQYAGKAPSDSPALKPYRGKPAVRNFRGGNGNVGIIRSPVRAIALPDSVKNRPNCLTRGRLRSAFRVSRFGRFFYPTCRYAMEREHRRVGRSVELFAAAGLLKIM